MIDTIVILMNAFNTGLYNLISIAGISTVLEVINYE